MKICSRRPARASAFGSVKGLSPGRLPPRVSEAEAGAAFGPDAVYYATRLRGAVNDKAKRELQFRPRPLEWLSPTRPKNRLPGGPMAIFDPRCIVWIGTVDARSYAGR